MNSDKHSAPQNENEQNLSETPKRSRRRGAESRHVDRARPVMKSEKLTVYRLGWIAAAIAVCVLVFIVLESCTVGRNDPHPTETMPATMSPKGAVSGPGADLLPHEIRNRDTAQPVITAENEEFAEILRDQECDARIGDFAQSNRGRTIEFDAHIAYVEHRSKDSRRVLYAGPEGNLTGPRFIYIPGDLNPADSAITATRAGQEVHVKAVVDRYEREQCLFFIRAVD